MWDSWALDCTKPVERILWGQIWELVCANMAHCYYGCAEFFKAAD